MKATMKTNGSKVEQTKVKTKDDSATDEGKGRWNQCRTDKGQYGWFLESCCTRNLELPFTVLVRYVLSRFSRIFLANFFVEGQDTAQQMKVKMKRRAIPQTSWCRLAATTTTKTEDWHDPISDMQRRRRKCRWKGIFHFTMKNEAKKIRVFDIQLGTTEIFWDFSVISLWLILISDTWIKTSNRSLQMVMLSLQLFNCNWLWFQGFGLYMQENKKKSVSLWLDIEEVSWTRSKPWIWLAQSVKKVAGEQRQEDRNEAW